MAGWDRAYEQVRASSSFHALVAYLDKHVPDGADDYVYAEDVTDDFVLATQRSLRGARVDGLIENLQQYYGVASRQQLRTVRQLATELAADVPMWANSGWSENELKAMG